MIRALLLAAFFWLSFTAPVRAKDGGKKRKPSGRPNFILILADDLGFADLSMNGSKQIATPNIDRLAASGVTFTEGYVSSPVCSPSRAGMLTGRNQVAFGHDNNIGFSQTGFDPEYLGLPLTETTVADRLSALGYVTGLVGKWHLGDRPQFHPTKRGFREFWGYTGGGHHYFKSEPNGKRYLSPIECNYKTPAPITYITDDKGDECVDFVKRHRDEPFFLFASFNAPHAPMHATEADLKLFGHIKDKHRRTYAAMVHRLDINVGKIMKAVKDNGLRKNTVVVFLSDNGGPVNHNASVNAPYNGQKGILLEGGIRVPFAVSWPGTLPKGGRYANPVSSLDLTPTFVALAGGKADATFDGVNLMPYVLGEKTEPPHETLLWRFTFNAAIREGDWKLVRLPDRLPLLFHLPTDISEQRNVSLKNLERTERMLKKLGDWDVSLPHPVFLEGAEWKERNLKLYDKEYPLVQPERVEAQ
ncbi:N-acetylgalactosamine-6-sulfatase [Fulvitalea axinellae]|uniref:N-acetylgalactosamine-6-sulfatase n=1 Tax=Fulvitalea axinellae TaxID=1182444 RepID=A0AAU9CNS2_9BACT|nr:N-acetylgalactosamine-6-sulfatase [Fulvitalea axinellae]